MRPSSQRSAAQRFTWRGLAFVLAATTSFVALTAGGCSTDAVGVEICRELEDARCEAAALCGIEGASDVDACKRFYRDHCLHGLGLEDEPSSSQVKRCKETLATAGACAKEGISLPGACEGLNGIQLSPEITTVCDIVLQPAETSSCRFLVPDEDPIPDAGPDSADAAGGTGGTSGGAAGASGSAGAGGTAGAGGSAGSSAGAAGAGG